MKHIMKCVKCFKYTMKEACCDTPTVSASPPKFSPEDKYADYRRKAKMQIYMERGLL